MNVFEFMSESPVLTFFLALFLAIILEYLFFKLPNRYFRSRNIANHGWPPQHCDADGDFKDES
jgi:hypothetical protein